MKSSETTPDGTNSFTAMTQGQPGERANSPITNWQRLLLIVAVFSLLSVMLGCSPGTSSSPGSFNTTATIDSKQKSQMPVVPSRGSVIEAKKRIQTIEREATRDTIVLFAMRLGNHEAALPQIVEFHDKWKAKFFAIKQSLAETSPFLNPVDDPSCSHADACYCI